MKGQIKTSGFITIKEGEHSLQKLIIETSLHNFKETKDPICFVHMLPHLNFYGVDEAAEELEKYLLKKRGASKKYTNQLWWSNICSIYRRLKSEDKWKEASHEALSNHVYHELKIAWKGSEPDKKFSEALRKQLSRNTAGKK